MLRLFSTALLLIATGAFAADHHGAQTTYVLTNEDGVLHNYIGFYTAAGTAGSPTLTFAFDSGIIGRGIGGGLFGTNRVATLADPSAQCVYASNAQTSDIAGVVIATGALAGNFNPSPSDTGATNGVGLAVTPNYVYAAYTDSNTIATFSVLPQCQLSFVDDVSAAGLNGGSVAGMAVHGNIMVVAYADGSIQSFNIADGVPVSNDDLQNSTGYVSSLTIDFPEGVDISPDGHWALFGDSSIATKVEVSDISTGHLAPTVLYTIPGHGHAVGNGVNSGSIRLSPDATMVFMGNSDGGSVSAGFFDTHTGKVRGGCTSAQLMGFYNPWAFVGSVTTRDTTGTGGVLYVAEYGYVGSSLGVVNIASDGSSCTLTESTGSFVPDNLSDGLLSITVYPPRPF